VPRHVARLVIGYLAYAAHPGASARRAARRATTSPTPRVRVPRLVAWLLVDYFAYAARPGASTRRVSPRRLLCLYRASGCLGSSRGSSSITSLTPRILVPRHVARLIVDYFAYAASPGASARHAARRRLLRLTQARRRLLSLRHAFGCLGTSCGLSSATSATPRVWVPRHVDYFAYTARLGASARRVTRCTARHRLLRLRRASGRLGTSHGSSRRSSSTTSPRAGSSLTTSPTPRVRVPQHVTRLVVDYFAYAARPGASARRAARHRLLRLRRATGCLGTMHDSSSTTSPMPRVRVPRHVGAHHAARRRLLQLLRATGCLGTTRISLLTTSPTPRVRVPRHVVRLVVPLIVDYFAYAARPGASAHHTAHRATRRRLLQLRRASGCLGTSRGSSSTTSPTPRVRVPRHVAWLIVNYFYAE
jgi:hypothetical protein